jgi:hypothetical protein
MSNEDKGKRFKKKKENRRQLLTVAILMRIFETQRPNR